MAGTYLIHEAVTPGPAGEHPLIRGAFESLPAPDTRWERAGRIAWLRAMIAAFDVLYGAGDTEISITPAPAADAQEQTHAQD